MTITVVDVYDIVVGLAGTMRRLIPEDIDLDVGGCRRSTAHQGGLVVHINLGL